MREHATTQPKLRAPGFAGPAQYLPLGVNVAGLRCLVVGGGRIGTRKALTLAEAGADVVVLSPEITNRLNRLVREDVVAWIRAAYDPSYLDGCSLVVAATSDPALNVAVGQNAEERGILSCLVSPGRLSRVLFPAVHAADGVTVAVHSNGRDCARSRAVRDELAGFLTRRGAPAAQFGVVGLRRPSVPAGVFERLANNSARPRRIGETDVIVLATCRRWECYFVAPSAPAVARDLLAFVANRYGVSLDPYRAALVVKSGAGAYHHFLRVAAGLDSPVLGETEIVGQIRRAAAAFRAAPPGLRNAFASVLLAQKHIRAESELARPGANWTEPILGALKARFPQLAGRRILLVGCGRLAESVAHRLRDEGADIKPFSRRAGATGIAWCARLGLAVRGHEALADAPPADAAVVTARLSDPHAELLCERTGLIVDLTGDERFHAHGAYRNLLDADGVPPTGADAARIARAAELALVHALRLLGRPAPPPRALRIGARPSELSRVQVGEVRRFLGALDPGAEAEVAWIDTPGDRDKRTPLPAVRDDDFFTRDLDAALRRGEIDLAVHNAKDLPERPAAGLCVAALTPAFAPWECLVSRDGAPLAEMPPGARVGTSSNRRRKRLFELRPDLVPCEIRGNVPDRVRQLDDGRYDALVLAATGLIRLGLADRVAQVFTLREFPPAPGQGSLALVVRADDTGLRARLASLDLGERRGLPWAQAR